MSKQFKMAKTDKNRSWNQLSQEQVETFCEEMEALAREKNLKTMPEGMIERIAHTPDVEYERPHFENW